MSKPATIYMVGGPTSPKTNSWEAMTNSWEEAQRIKAELGPGAVHKAVQVQPPKRGAKR